MLMVFNSQTDISKMIMKMPVPSKATLFHDRTWAFDHPEIVVDSEINPSVDKVLCVDDPEMIHSIKALIAIKAQRARELAATYRCPMCGYTHKDAMIHMDHAICVRKGGPEMPEITQEERERLSREIMSEQYT